ncbi:hypothetical protein C8F01DRAFT_178039, partial [Mycena amicta]
TTKCIKSCADPQSALHLVSSSFPPFVRVLPSDFPPFFFDMLNKAAAVLFSALIVSGALAVPLPHIKLDFKTGTNDVTVAQNSPVTASVAAAGLCNETLVTELISKVSDTANFILSVGFVAPDPDRNTDAKAATFDTLIADLDAAGKAAAAGDFATAKTRLDVVRQTAEDLIDPEAAQDGQVSGADFDLRTQAEDASDAAASCL